MEAAGRILTLVALLAAALAALAPASASARADDKILQIMAPGEGAVIKDATKGLVVDFTCPVYHQYEYDNVITFPTEGYHVVLSTSGEVDQYGLLLPVGQVDVRDPILVDDAEGHCSAAPDDAGNGILPREPGAYWLQAWRECASYLCRGGVEVAPPVNFTVQKTVCSATRAQIGAVKGALNKARAALKKRRTEARRRRVRSLTSRATGLRQRLRVVYGCKA